MSSFIRRRVPAKEAGPRHLALRLGLWALQILLVALFAGAGTLKLSGAPAMVSMFAAIGAGQWFRYVVGSLELAGALGLLVPRLAGPAALGLACLMVGATVTQVLIIRTDQLLPVCVLVLVLLLTWARRRQILALVAALRS